MVQATELLLMQQMATDLRDEHIKLRPIMAEYGFKREHDNFIIIVHYLRVH